ncbi:hypothetical protein KV097_03370 [Mumia sp. zg.B17]|uniref:hypothetical protein n=1 Tax=unclassified Mumia TaxID=2621872 RepID=UPI001C6ED27C|nr:MULTISPECIES: hypothetical protein [unclassified Mumia]MBW9204969.1 hypothetical protein [Mumia sp. zg.B17]MBW9209026.1 hypothetical protein [Mumia sp. zg.B21]
MSDVAAIRHPVPALVRLLDVAAKGLLVLMLALALAFPQFGNLEDKGAGLRAIAYPMLAFTIPVIWHLYWRERASFPWLADLLVTITCFTDILGNRMDLYDTIVWFDDWMHFMNTGLLAGAVILLTLPRTATLGMTLERALAFGVTAAVVWELAEYFAFISKSAERHSAYSDTLGDLTLGTLGALVAAAAIHAAWRRGRLHKAAPQLEGKIVTPEVGAPSAPGPRQSSL